MSNISYNLTSALYRVTWTQNSPTDYSSLTGTQAGGLDITSASEYNRAVSVTGNIDVSGAGISAGNAMILNGVTITFPTTTTTASVITDYINTFRSSTGVQATQGVKTNYITLTNDVGHAGAPFYIADSTTSPSLFQLGLTAGTYSYGVANYGAGFTNVSNGDNVAINNTLITFTTAGGLTLPGVVNTINQSGPATSIAAQVAAGNIQIVSTSGNPIVVNGGSAASKIGLPVGTWNGTPATLAASTNKELGNMRWSLVVSQLETMSTPYMIGDFAVTGNSDGSGTPTTFSFTIGYNKAEQVYTIEQTGEPNPGNTLYGEAAIKRLVARALTSSYTSNRKLYDPTTQTVAAGASRPNAFRIQQLTATGIDTASNITTIEANILVTKLINV